MYVVCTVQRTVRRCHIRSWCSCTESLTTSEPATRTMAACWLRTDQSSSSPSTTALEFSVRFSSAIRGFHEKFNLKRYVHTGQPIKIAPLPVLTILNAVPSNHPTETSALHLARSYCLRSLQHDCEICTRMTLVCNKISTAPEIPCGRLSQLRWLLGAL